MATLKVHRTQVERANTSDLRDAVIYIDGTAIGRVEFQDSATFNVDPGRHLFGVRLSGNFGRLEVEVDVPHDGVQITCRRARSMADVRMLYKPSRYWAVEVSGI